MGCSRKHRHSFISNLARAGVTPKVAQDLARHSDINLTMSRYTHTVVEDRARAVATLPSLMAESNAEALRKTGTDDAETLPIILPLQGSDTAIPCDRRRRSKAWDKTREALQIKAKPSKKEVLRHDARMAELADALDLGSSPERDGGSSPPPRTNMYYL